MRGTAYCFGDEINTDLIAPAIASHDGDLVDVLFQPIRPGFAETVSPGDIVVAGEHFGSGSSRETAPQAISDAEIGAVVAESFSRIFYRNAIAIGLPAVVCPDVTDAVSEGDEIELDVDSGVLENHSTGETLSFEPIAPEIRSIFDSGGLLAHYDRHPEGLRIE